MRRGIIHQKKRISRVESIARKIKLTALATAITAGGVLIGLNESSPTTITDHDAISTKTGINNEQIENFTYIQKRLTAIEPIQEFKVDHE